MPETDYLPDPLPDWHYHFLGIGGVGMSAIAQVLHGRGFRISGSDAHDSPTLEHLKSLGISAQVGHELPEGVEAVVYTSAISEDHPIWEAVRQRKLPRFHRAEVLGALTRQSETLAVTGTHGKTTSTACLAYALTSAGWDPTALVGGNVPQFGGTTVRLGDSKWLVVEADESDGSFNLLSPQAILLTNIEAEHLDFHGSLEGMVASFQSFLNRLPTGGQLVYCKDDPLSERLAVEWGGDIISYGFSPSADVRVAVEMQGEGRMAVRLTRQGRTREISTLMTGGYNGLNMAGVYGLLCGLGLSEEEAGRGLAGFRGVARRQQFLGAVNECRIYDDYAHHPTEVRVTLNSFIEQYGQPLTVVFQPHLYSRTAYFAQDFADALRPAQRIYITDIYGAREEPIEGVSSRLILDCLSDHPGAFPLPNWRDAPEVFSIQQLPEGIFLTMGAGDITDLGPLLLKRFGAS